MRIAHATSVHPSLDTRIFHREALSLAAAGHTVSLIAPGGTEAPTGPIKVVSVPRARSRRERMTSTLLHVYAAARSERADVYHLHDPELIVVGLMLKAFGHRVIYDVHEDYALQLRAKTWLPRVLRPIALSAIRIAEKLASLTFDAVIAATPQIAHNFPSHKTWIVQNFPDPREVPKPRTPYRSRRFNIAYVGGISEVRGISAMVEAIGLLPEHLGVRLVLAGQFYPPALRDQLAATRAWQHVDYRGWLGRPAVGRLVGEARAGLVLLQPLPNYLESYPTKMFEYMQAGTPVIVSNFPLWKEIVGNSHSGLTVNPLSAQEIAEAVRWILDNEDLAEEMGQRGEALVKAHYSWSNESEKLLAAYSAISRGNTSVRGGG